MIVCNLEMKTHSTVTLKRKSDGWLRIRGIHNAAQWEAYVEAKVKQPHKRVTVDYRHHVNGSLAEGKEREKHTWVSGSPFSYLLANKEHLYYTLQPPEDISARKSECWFLSPTRIVHSRSEVMQLPDRMFPLLLKCPHGGGANHIRVILSKAHYRNTKFTRRVSVATHYIPNPILHRGRKTDCRLFIMICQHRNRSWLHVCNKGIARIATSPYSILGKGVTTKVERAQHLTNFTKEFMDFDTYLRQVVEKEYEISKKHIWAKIYRMFDTVARAFIRKVNEIQAEEKEEELSSSVFTIFSCDFLITDIGDVYLLEFDRLWTPEAWPPSGKIMFAAFMHTLVHGGHPDVRSRVIEEKKSLKKV